MSPEPLKRVRQDQLSKKVRQSRFLESFPDSQFVIVETCRRVGIDRKTVQRWLEEPEFKARFDDAYEVRKDLIEKAILEKCVEEKDTATTIFLAKTLCKDRGYSERESGNPRAKTLLRQVKEGTLSARDAGYEFAILGLPLPEVLKIELQKQEPIPAELPDGGMTTEELDAKYSEAMAAIDEQEANWVPERQAQVEEIKEALKDDDGWREEERL